MRSRPLGAQHCEVCGICGQLPFCSERLHSQCNHIDSGDGIPTPTIVRSGIATNVCVSRHGKGICVEHYDRYHGALYADEKTYFHAWCDVEVEAGGKHHHLLPSL
jgi:hypothetical protein